MNRPSILWADDEIELLKPHILFLDKKGYDITPVNSGTDALEQVEGAHFDVVFLDENMPGMTGLETLAQIKALRPTLPVVMITKSEEEYIMEEAIGSKIDDYLIKPINPNQILLSVKKILDKKRIVSEKTNTGYQREFQQISMAVGDELTFAEWAEIHKKLVYWDLEIEQTENQSMADVLEMQKAEANGHFWKFVKHNYLGWLDDPEGEDTPVLSYRLLREKVFPLLKGTERPTFFILIDNLRYDQWKVIEPTIADYFKVEEESTYCSILPTTTAYARNAIFGGMTPLEISQRYPDLWSNDNDEGGKNEHEEALLELNLKNSGLRDVSFTYNKIIHANQGKKLLDKLNNLMQSRFNALVYNFVDMLSHARTDTAMIRELAPDEAAYRSLTLSWFQHSSLLDALKTMAEAGAQVVITTDHGTTRVRRPYKIVGDRETNTNLRYKQGRNLTYDKKQVFVAHKPERFELPRTSVSASYVFSTEDHFFAYPNNYNHYVKYYKDTFQHGGISLDEVIIPFVRLSAK